MIRTYIFLTLMLAAGFTHSCKKNFARTDQASREEQQAQRVVVQKVQRTNDPIPVPASGVVASKAETDLSFKIGGIIDRLLVEEGQSVTAGQLLGTIQMAEINAQVRKAERAMEKAQRDLARINKLYADSAATYEQVQNLKTAFEVAEADLEIAQFNQQYAKIAAPQSGRVLKRFAEPGELVSPGTPVYRIASNRGKGFTIQVGIADRDIVRLRKNDKATVRFDAYPGKEFSAYISEIPEAADPRTGAFDVELTLTSTQALLKDGFVGKIEIFPSQQPFYYKIAMDALVEGHQNRASIFVADRKALQSKRVIVRPQQIGPDFFTVAVNALDENSWVVTEGAAYLKDGMAIEVVEDIARGSRY